MGEGTNARRERVIAAVMALVPPEGAEFCRRFYRGAAPADLEALGAADLAAGAESLRAFAAERETGAPKLRLFRVPADSPWAARQSVLEIINDDMPFLVDSVGIVLQRHGIGIDLNIHPVMSVTRDENGRMVALEGPEALRESLMQVRLTGARDTATYAQIEAELITALADVRAAVEDWRPMLARLTVARAAAELSAEDPAETLAFIEWLREHFVFLGAREYRFEGTGDDAQLAVVEGAGLGVLRDPAAPVYTGQRALGQMPPAVRRFLESPTPVLIAKGGQRATVHRAAHLDVIGIRDIGRDGRVRSEHRFVGLFTSKVYSAATTAIPLIRSKVKQVIAGAGLDPRGHDGKALETILEQFPRDELFQIGVEELLEISTGILELQDRQRVALFTRRDGLERFVSCLVYLPRERYDARLRRLCHEMLARELDGRIDASYVMLGDAPLARLHVVVGVTAGAIPAIDHADIGRRIAEASVGWPERLYSHGERIDGDQGLERLRRWADAFPPGYRDAFEPADAWTHLDLLEHALTVAEQPRAAPAIRLAAKVGEAGRLRLVLVRAGGPVALSDALPLLENLGVRVLTETPHAVRPADGPILWLQDFELEASGIDPAAPPLAELCFAAVWEGRAENDALNRLVLACGMPWRDVALIRAYARYLRQVGLPYPAGAIADTLARHGELGRKLVALFAALHHPADADAGRAEELARTIGQGLEHVTAADEDRILRRLLNAIQSTLRTNYFLERSTIAFKLDSRRLDDLPPPRPIVEMWVYAPEVEAVHLRGGPVARGGIRWSDRREDFRTEVLGLVKAQMVKNAVIVPIGSKGGFVPKTEPPTDPAQRMAWGVAAYRTFIGTLLDLTDTRTPSGIRAPEGIVRRDGDDPYLVVAADKGTATFSDHANALAVERGFWLGDAFASGGSKGYDHKALGITARGAWVGVARHFRELGVDPRSDAITVIGVGDMSGDVFGNGMLHGPNLTLVAAFDHRHIFLDPDPNPEKAFAERKRLFALPRSSWDDYDRRTLSPGGLIVPRTAKSVPLSAEARARFGIDAERPTPNELVRHLLGQPVDLLWFGGIGTFVKAADEGHADVGDRANDAVRLDARDLRARVIGEGANLGMTQRARIEAAQAGVRLNTDAIDNSAGVDMSDHEVNIKILLAEPVARGALSADARDRLLATMADEVSDLVLEDNRRQTLAVSMAEREGADIIGGARALIRRLEREVGLDRAIEFLPSDAQLAARQGARQGLARPEIAVLLAYTKIWVKRSIAESELLDDPDLAADLAAYFPTPLREGHADAIARHGLRRAIVATVLTNQLVDRAGITVVDRLMRESGAGIERVAETFVAMRALLGLSDIWEELDKRDLTARGTATVDLYRATGEALATAMRWLLHRADAGGAGEHRRALAGPVRDLIDRLPGLVDLNLPELLRDSDGSDIANRIATLARVAESLDVLTLAERADTPIIDALTVWQQVGGRFAVEKLIQLARGLPQTDPATREAVTGLVEDLAAHRRAITAAALAAGSVEVWIAGRAERVQTADQTIGEVTGGPAPFFARLALAERAVRGLAQT